MRKVVPIILAIVAIAWLGSVATAGSGVIKTSGGERMVPNALVMATLKFVPGPTSASQGDTLTWVHADQTEDPHTISIVDRSDVPTTIDEVFECEVCQDIFEAHSEGGFHPVVDVGKPGLDRPGDSLFLPPGGEISAEVSASPGTTLDYICAIHPWMQGTIRVS